MDEEYFDEIPELRTDDKLDIVEYFGDEFGKRIIDAYDITRETFPLKAAKISDSFDNLRKKSQDLIISKKKYEESCTDLETILKNLGEITHLQTHTFIEIINDTPLKTIVSEYQKKKRDEISCQDYETLPFLINQRIDDFLNSYQEKSNFIDLSISQIRYYFVLQLLKGEKIKKTIENVVKVKDDFDSLVLDIEILLEEQSFGVELYKLEEFEDETSEMCNNIYETVEKFEEELAKLNRNLNPFIEKLNADAERLLEEQKFEDSENTFQIKKLYENFSDSITHSYEQALNRSTKIKRNLNLVNSHIGFMFKWSSIASYFDNPNELLPVFAIAPDLNQIEQMSTDYSLFISNKLHPYLNCMKNRDFLVKTINTITGPLKMLNFIKRVIVFCSDYRLHDKYCEITEELCGYDSQFKKYIDYIGKELEKSDDVRDLLAKKESLNISEYNKYCIYLNQRREQFINERDYILDILSKISKGLRHNRFKTP